MVTARLSVKGFLPAEIAHFYEPATGNVILSSASSFRARVNGHEVAFTLPQKPWQRAAGLARLARRALRLDKSNAVPNAERDGIVIVFRGRMYFYDLRGGELKQAGSLRQCRNVLHSGIAVTERGIFLGEYGGNPKREAVPVWRSTDGGRSWEIAHEFPAGLIKHIHGIYADPHSSSLWIPTGDFRGECYVFELPDGDFARLVRHGDGNQRWRPVSMFFDPDRIVWGMDSPLEPPHLQVFDRRTGTLSQGRAFPGPVWYSKRFTDGSAILETSVESGPGVQSRSSHLFFSEDLTTWTEVGRFAKDRWPMVFKFGVIAFADGAQPRDDFLLFGEALVGIDGKVMRAGILAR